MKILNVISALVLVVILAGCQTVQVSMPTPIHVSGYYNHPGSGMVFPERVGEFQRVQITQFAPSEKDVGVGYNSNGVRAPISATVYVYPAPRLISVGSPPSVVDDARTQLFHGHLEVLKREVMRAHPDARLLSEENFTLSQEGQKHNGRKVTFELAYTFGITSQDSISQICLFQTGKWLVKYRITFPKATTAEVQGAIGSLLNGIELPKKKDS